MVRVIACDDPTVALLEECVEGLNAWTFDPREPESLSHAAHWLRRLGNDRSFLGDFLIEGVATGAADGAMNPARIGDPPHRITLAAPARASYRICANIWPALDDPALQWNGGSGPGYGEAHSHAHDLLALGYFGPGCPTEHFEIEPDTIEGSPCEPANLRAIGQMALGEGCILHYRARRDVHRIHPPQSLSISLSIHHVSSADRGVDGLAFDPEAGLVLGAYGRDVQEVILDVAVALGVEGAREYAIDVGRSHPSDRIRLAAWEALAAHSLCAETIDEVWREAERSGGRAVARVARQRLTRL